MKHVLPRFLSPAQRSWQVSPLASLITLGAVEVACDAHFDLQPTCLMQSNEIIMTEWDKH